MDYLQKKSIRSVAAAIAGFLRHCVRKIGITREKLPSCIALAVCPLVTFYLFEMYTHNPFTTMHFKTQLLNMAFEDKFGVTIADEDLGTLKTVGDIFNYLAARAA